MNLGDDLNAKLDEIVRLVRIIALPRVKEFKGHIESKFLNTKERKKMYELIDGQRTMGEIAERVNVSHEAVRLFVKDLDAEKLIQIEKMRSPRIPKKLV